VPAFELDNVAPVFPPDGDYWIAHDANIIGHVIIERLVSIWFGSTLRGDNEPITIGHGTNIQENCVLHTDMGFPLIVGANCTVGHKALLHGCELKDGCLVGMGATVLNGATIGEEAVVAAGALVPEGKTIAPRTLNMGVPARCIRVLKEHELEGFRDPARHYRRNVKRYKSSLKPIVES